MSTSKSLSYCSKRDGDLGMKMEALGTSTALKQGITLLNTLDPAIRTLLQETELDMRLQSLAKEMRLTWTVLNFRNIEAYKRRQKADELKHWSELTKGRGIPCFTDGRNGNAWLYHPTLQKPSQFM
jgi:hypothetical protein